MPVTEVGPGQHLEIPLFAMRVELTGGTDGVVLSAVDQAGREPEDVQRTPSGHLVLAPRRRKLRLLARPALSTEFEAGTRLGLMVRNHGTAGPSTQILGTPVDVGGLTSYELAEIDCTAQHAVLTIPAREANHGLRDLPWVQAGRYAMRAAESLDPPAPPPDAWALVVDCSSSILPYARNGQLGSLVELVAGIYVQWTGRVPDRVVLPHPGVGSGPAIPPDNPLASPATGLEHVSSDGEPASWFAPAAAVATLARAVRREQGLHVLVVTDGVPADVDTLAGLLSVHSDLRLSVITTGRSAYGLPSDGADLDWWEEELAGLAALAESPRGTVVAVRSRPDHGYLLADSRPAELARALTTWAADAR